MQNIGQKAIERLVLPVPPLEVQQRIVDVLDSIAELERKIEASIVKIQKVRQGVMLAHLGPVLGIRSTVINAGWEESRVGDLFEMQLGKMLDKEAVRGRDLRPYLTNRNVQWGRIGVDDIGRMEFALVERSKFRLLPGDLIVTEGGEVGRAAIWDGQISECYFQKSLHRLRPKGEVSSEFMLCYMEFAAKSGLLVDYVVQTSIAHLPQERFARMPVVYPRSAASRDRIVDAIQRCDSQALVEQSELCKLRKVKQGLVDDLLSGRSAVLAAAERRPALDVG
ncbi:restriction endonuclease subunit S [Streptomyces griseorubiginosus]|uniref:restriction endonuclease subunit S n=1 Tax=Streptomyces griseorubiginosus TaxID=67304 RepID=UPI0036C89135